MVSKRRQTIIKATASHSRKKKYPLSAKWLFTADRGLFCGYAIGWIWLPIYRQWYSDGNKGFYTIRIWNYNCINSCDLAFDSYWMIIILIYAMLNHSAKVFTKKKMILDFDQESFSFCPEMLKCIPLFADFKPTFFRWLWSSWLLYHIYLNSHWYSPNRHIFGLP